MALPISKPTISLLMGFDENLIIKIILLKEIGRKRRREKDETES